MTQQARAPQMADRRQPVSFLLPKLRPNLGFLHLLPQVGELSRRFAGRLSAFVSHLRHHSSLNVVQNRSACPVALSNRFYIPVQR